MCVLSMKWYLRLRSSLLLYVISCSLWSQIFAARRYKSRFKKFRILYHKVINIKRMTMLETIGTSSLNLKYQSKCIASFYRQCMRRNVTLKCTKSWRVRSSRWVKRRILCTMIWKRRGKRPRSWRKKLQNLKKMDTVQERRVCIVLVYLS